MTRDQNGATFIGPVVGLGIGVPVTFGSVTGSIANTSVTTFLGGWSIGFNAGTVVGGGIQGNASGLSIERGFMTPQVGFAFGLNYCYSGPC